MIEVKGINFEIEGRKILHDINFTIEDSSTYTLLGPSGCGKSTILRNIVGLAHPSSGEILFDGIDITKANKKQINEIRSKCGFLFQQSALFDSMTIEDNLKFPILQSPKRYSEAEMDKMVNEKLEMVDMPGINKLFPSELSGGMKKRAALARSIILEPKYIFYDEPTTGLDP
ncbi:MAG: ATP-binding cassette domain-containing protein, partial [Fusobacteria bacterium]|nr:ATP-binding cassette domain-containing protein [Fusobacteriota bacterium]